MEPNPVLSKRQWSSPSLDRKGTTSGDYFDSASGVPDKVVLSAVARSSKGRLLFHGSWATHTRGSHKALAREGLQPHDPLTGERSEAGGKASSREDLYASPGVSLTPVMSIAHEYATGPVSRGATMHPISQSGRGSLLMVDPDHPSMQGKELGSGSVNPTVHSSGNVEHKMSDVPPEAVVGAQRVSNRAVNRNLASQFTRHDGLEDLAL